MGKVSFVKLPSDEWHWTSLMGDDKSTLVQVMACWGQAPSHYLSQCWSRSMPPHGITRPQRVNTFLGFPCDDAVSFPQDQYIAVHQAVQELFKRHLSMIDQHFYENIDKDGQPKVLSCFCFVLVLQGVVWSTASLLTHWPLGDFNLFLGTG